MANVLNRTTKVYLESVSTPDFDPADYIINPDLSAVEGIPSKFWKITGDAVSEMSQAEKDSLFLSDNKEARRKAIDAKTVQLIGQGFTFDSNTFSLSEPAQLNWVGLKTLEAALTWPVNITTKDDKQYSLTQANLDSFMGTGLAAKQAHLDSGRALKLQVDAATDQATLDAIVDNR